MGFYLFIQVIVTHIDRDQDKLKHLATVQDTAHEDDLVPFIWASGVLIYDKYRLRVV